MNGTSASPASWRQSLRSVVGLLMDVLKAHLGQRLTTPPSVVDHPRA